MMDELQAGRELDALVADKVFGLKFSRYPAGSVADRDGWEFQPLATDDTIMFGPKHYSTDITAAWTVVDKMGRDGWRWTADFRDDGEFANAWRFHRGAGVHRADEPTAPLAICRAALRATGR